MTCKECHSRSFSFDIDTIFGTPHEFADCNDCICLYVKRIDTGEWIESSSLTHQRDIGKSTGQQSLQRYPGSAI